MTINLALIDWPFIVTYYSLTGGVFHEEWPWSNVFWPGLTPFGPPLWQAEADTELTLTLSASPTTAKGLALAKRP